MLHLFNRIATPAGLFSLLLFTANGWAQDGEQPLDSGDKPVENTESAGPSEEEAEDPFRWNVAGGDIYQFEGDIDGGGRYSVNRTFLGAGMEFDYSPALTLDFDIGMEWDNYDFSGKGAFSEPAAGTPWESVFDLTLSAVSRWRLDDNWRLILGGFVRWSGETDADFTKSFSGGGVFGGAYVFSDDLSLGATGLVTTQIEDGLLWIPSPIVDWRINKQLFISNMRGPVTYPASLGLEIIYYLNENMNVSLGGRYEYRRFRLNDDGPTAIRNGVGGERTFPIWLRFEWRPINQIRIHLLTGVNFGQRLELENAQGNLLSREDTDPSPFIGAFLGFRF
jgi:hypothetical protein